MSEKLEQVINYVRQDWRKKIDESLNWSFATIQMLSESPIEELLGCALAGREMPTYGGSGFLGNDNPPTVMPFEYWSGVADKIISGAEDFAILVPQAKIPPYRVDFLLIFKSRHCSLLKMVIECDGHDFHERTKEQARRDRARDRNLAALGYQVVRFTGSEIHQDAQRCADDVVGIIQHRIHGDDF